ncbi:MAG TPA: ATPase, T2SS/T4P/T4SS family [Candidatus Eisenbacteria bacterium]|nr:ATPase, T2SS/T4P/T4SS family [Candidatus Eisenbacteria bacterium]
MTSILMDCGLVTSEQIEEAVSRQIETGRMIGETLVELGFTTEESIVWALSKQLGIPFADVQPQAIDGELVRHFPESLLRRTQAVPLFRSAEDGITIACADPSDTEAIASLQEAAESAVSFVIGGPASIRRALDTILGPARPSPAEARAAILASGESTPASDIVWDRGGRNFLLFHLHTARERKASEIHFIPTVSSLTVAYRTDRGLEPQANELPETALYLRTRLHALGVPDLDHGSATTARGCVTVDLEGGRVALEVFHARTIAGVATVVRISPLPHQAPELSHLGLSPIGEAEIREFVDGPEGIVLVSGPPRSGGSMLLASLTALAARNERRVLILDDGAVVPYPHDAVRVHAAPGASSGERWDTLALGLGADVVVLDNTLRGEAIADVLSGATVGRLVFARTDWLDGKALLNYLASRPTGRAVLRDRPFALVMLPNCRHEGADAWASPEGAEGRAGCLEVTLLTDDDRDALARGGKNK